MLDLLNKNKKEYVTREELQSLITYMRSMPHMKGNKGDDAKIDSKLIRRIKALVKPIRGVDYQDGYTPIKGKDYFDGYTPIKGKDYFDGDAITDEQLSKRLQSLKGDLRPRMDNIKGLKKYLNRVNDLSKGYSDVAQDVDLTNERIEEIILRLGAIRVDIQDTKKDGVLTRAEMSCSDPATLTLVTELGGEETEIPVDVDCLVSNEVTKVDMDCTSHELTVTNEKYGVETEIVTDLKCLVQSEVTDVEINCATKILTITNTLDGVDSEIQTDLSCLFPTSHCAAVDPEVTDLAVDTSVWRNTESNMVFQMICGQWFPMQLVIDPEYVTESGDNIVAENGDSIDTE